MKAGDEAESGDERRVALRKRVDGEIGFIRGMRESGANAQVQHLGCAPIARGRPGEEQIHHPWACATWHSAQAPHRSGVTPRAITRAAQGSSSNAAAAISTDCFQSGRVAWFSAMYQRLRSGTSWCVFDIMLF